MIDVLHSARFVDASPRQIWATLLDEEQHHLCSVRTMYRLLEAEGELRERRKQRRHPVYTKPELVASAPNEVWTWDIERHEALFDRAEMKGLRLLPVAAGR